jgi:hypothetical protein
MLPAFHITSSFRIKREGILRFGEFLPFLYSCVYVKEDAFERTIEEEDLNYLLDREKYVLSEKETGDYREAQVSLNQLHDLVTSPR